MRQVAEGVLALIPARGGSRGIPRKNIRPFLGRPLIEWTVETAVGSNVFSHIVVSTDDRETADIALRAGAEAPFLRPQSIAGDQSPTLDAILHALDWYREEKGWSPELVFILEPTSPTRRPDHIREAVALFDDPSVDTVASISEVPHHFVPEKVLKVEDSGDLTGVDGRHIRSMIHRRQDLPVSWALNGLIYAVRGECLQGDSPTIWGTRVVGLRIEDEYVVDIDGPADWPIAEDRMRAILENENA